MSCRRASSLTLAALLVAATGHAAPRARGEYLLVAGGDTMIARGFPTALAAHGPRWSFGPVGEILRRADLALVNLECVVSTRGGMTDKGERRPFLYRAPPATLEVLVGAGVDVVTTANNHTLDYGTEALFDQLELLAAAGIAQAGAGRDQTAASAPTYIKVGEVILAVIAVDDQATHGWATPTGAGTNSYADEAALAAALIPVLAEARARAHLVVISPHWGRNWRERPTAARLALAHALIDAGADAILGHSAHQLQGVEIHRGRPIVYDMGTFLWDWVRRAAMRQSAAVLLRFDAAGFTELTLKPVRLRNGRVRFAALAEAKQTCVRLDELSAELGTRLPFDRAERSCAVSLTPEPRPPPSRPAIDAAPAGRARSLPDAIKERLPEVVVPSPPAWTEGFEPVELEQGVTVLGARIPEATAPTTGFVVEVALRVEHPLRFGWTGVIIAEHGSESFSWDHPIADGAWIPERWQAGQIVIDRTLVRPSKRLSWGPWQLAWGMRNPRNRSWLRTVDEPRETRVPIGGIEVYWLTAPYRPAGLGWDGRRASLRSWIWALIGLGIAAACWGALFALRRRHRRRVGARDTGGETKTRRSSPRC